MLAKIMSVQKCRPKNYRPKNVSLIMSAIRVSANKKSIDLSWTLFHHIRECVTGLQR